jgi:hypothetical protein
VARETAGTPARRGPFEQRQGKRAQNGGGPHLMTHRSRTFAQQRGNKPGDAED